MKLCIVTHKLLKGDGQARVNYEIVKEVLRRGHHVTVFASYVVPELTEKENLSWIRIPVKGWPTQLLKNLIFSLISTFFLLLHKHKYDLTMVNGFITWVKSDINAVHYVHGSWLKSAAHPYRLNKNASGCYQLVFTYMNSVFEKIAFSRTNYLVPVSEKVKQELAERGFKQNIRVIANGVDIEEFSPLKKTERGRLGLPDGVPLALFAGDIKSRRKNLDTVLKALVEVKELHLAVAGSTKGSPFIKLAERLGVSDRVYFLGFRKDMAELMSSVDFFVFPSRYEACTLAVIEALASGLPVITTYQSGVSELVVSESKAGIVLDNPEDAEELREAMTRLCNDAKLRLELGINARQVAERQSWEYVAGSYIALFEEAAAGKSGKLESSNLYSVRG